MRKVLAALCFLVVGLGLPAGEAFAQAAIVGGEERTGFAPGDRVLYEAPLPTCPVGEVLADWRINRGSWECARFADRIWMRPLEHGTLIWRELDALPAEFALEFTVHGFAAGRPSLLLSLHAPSGRDALARGDIYGDSDVLIGALLRAGGEALFGAKNAAPGSLEGRWAARAPLAAGRDHHVAIQVRRGQVRFFLDGRRLGVLPFQPEAPVTALSLVFRRTVDAAEPFAEAPMLVTGLRLTAYEAPEAAPEPERDLAAELGAVETDEGLKITLAEQVLFDFGRWALKPGARETLTKVARLAAKSGGPVRVIGHTDSVGSEAFNRVLSELRAHVVALELARLGVEPARLMPEGRGESEPVAPNDTEEGRAKNRRVEIVLAPAG